QVRGDVAARAGTVLDQHRLTPEFAPAVADQARVDVGDAADREGDDDPDGLGGVRLREDWKAENQSEAKSKAPQGNSPARRKCFCASTARPSRSASRARSRCAAREAPKDRLAS